jgi:hypothetical protein
MHSSILLFLLASTLAAQDELPGFGVKAGLPLSSTSLPGMPNTSESWFRWTAGFSGEVPLFWHLSFEGDALIRKFSLGNRKQTDWDFPMLAKYRFHVKRFRPFVESGLSLSYESQEEYGGGGVHITTYRYDTGPVAGAGLQFRRGRLRFEPELRFTWLYQREVSGSNGLIITPMVGLRF